MSEFGVYEDEMLKQFSDQDIDRLLSGKTPEREELTRLAPILGALHTQGGSPSEDRVARFATEAGALIRSTSPEQSATPGRTLTRSRRFVLALRQKLATGLTATLLLSGLTGVAVASNDAAPGDPLFGVDQLLEEIGIGDGEAAERIAEAQALFKVGHVAEAIAHAAEAVEVTESDVEVFSPETSNASTALLDAAAKMAGGDDADIQSQDMRDRVALMLEEMALMMENPDFDGEVFGQQVAEMARGISPAPEELPDTANEAADNGAENADDASEESEDAGPPEDVPAGPPDTVPPSGAGERP